MRLIHTLQPKSVSRSHVALAHMSQRSPIVLEGHAHWPLNGSHESRTPLEEFVGHKQSIDKIDYHLKRSEEKI